MCTVESLLNKPAYSGLVVGKTVGFMVRKGPCMAYSLNEEIEARKLPALDTHTKS